MGFASAYTTGTELDYRPFWNIQAPAGFNFVGTVYPTSAPVQPSTWGGWTLTP